MRPGIYGTPFQDAAAFVLGMEQKFSGNIDVSPAGLAQHFVEQVIDSLDLILKGQFMSITFAQAGRNWTLLISLIPEIIHLTVLIIVLFGVLFDMIVSLLGTAIIKGLVDEPYYKIGWIIGILVL
jgi:hypothetical protein